MHDRWIIIHDDTGDVEHVPLTFTGTYEQARHHARQMGLTFPSYVDVMTVDEWFAQAEQDEA